MKKRIAFAALSFGLLMTAAPAAAQLASASHNVTITVSAVDVISVSGDLTIDINTVALSNTGSATYDLTTNGAGRKISAALSTDYSAGLTLDVTVAAPVGSGASVGLVTLSPTAQDVVTGISNIAETGLAIDYVATAAPSTPPSSESRQVTYTVTI